MRHPIKDNLNSQNLVRYGIISRRSEIPHDFLTKNDSVNHQTKSAALEKYKTWLLAHHIVKSRVPELMSFGVPSFIAVNSLLETNSASITRAAFTAIIHYPVTEYHIINTAIINFQMCFCTKDLRVVHSGRMRNLTELLRSSSLFSPLILEISI